MSKKMENLTKFYEQLTKLRDDRHLTLLDQRKGFVRNVMEQFGELSQAIKDNDSEAKIDTLCDILVFSLNCVELGDIKNSSFGEQLRLRPR